MGRSTRQPGISHVIAALALLLVAIAHRQPAAASQRPQRDVVPDVGAAVAPPARLSNAKDAAKLRKRLRQEIAAVTRASREDRLPRPKMQVVATSRRAGYELTTFTMPVDGGLNLRAAVAVPLVSMKLRATLLIGGRDFDNEIAPDGDLDLLARDGTVVMVLEPRPPAPSPRDQTELPDAVSLVATPPGTPPLSTLLGLRIDDTRRAISWLAGHRAVSADISVHGVGPYAAVALHTSVLDERIRRVVVEGLVPSYRLLLGATVPMALRETFAPGLLRHYDIGDLILAAFPARVAIVAPVDASGTRLSAQAFSVLFSETAQTEAKLKSEPVTVPRITAVFAP